MTTPPETDIRAYIKTAVEAEFSTENFTVEDTKLLRAAGMDGRNRVATSPVRARENDRVAIRLDVEVTLQMYLAFEAEPDEDRTVNPAVIEGYGGRVRTCLAPNSAMATANLWGLRVTEIDYPDDPNGQKTRLEATIEGFADNPAALGP